MTKRRTYRDIALTAFGEEGIHRWIESSIEGSSKAEGVCAPSYSYHPSNPPLRIASELRLAAVPGSSEHVRDPS